MIPSAIELSLQTINLAIPPIINSGPICHLKMKSTLVISTVLSVLSATADAYANPMPCSGTCVNTHDPSLVRRDDGTYFRFSTGGNVAVHTAPSIQGPWTYRGAALPDGSKIKKAGNQDLWAPDVSKVGDTYYLYYTVSVIDGHDSAIGVATSTTMDVGSWTDLGSTGVESVAGSRFNAIDGNLQSADGKLYLNFGSFWSDLFQIELTASPTTIAKAVAEAAHIAYVPTPPSAQEAAFGYKYGNYYYLFFSVGSCCKYDTDRPAAGKEYRIKACRSSSVSGPFVSLPIPDQSKIVLIVHRSTRTASRVSKVAVLQFLSLTAGYMDRAVRELCRTQIWDLSCITTTLTHVLAMLMVRRNLVSTSLTSAVGGQSYKLWWIFRSERAYGTDHLVLLRVSLYVNYHVTVGNSVQVEGRGFWHIAVNKEEHRILEHDDWVYQ